MTEGGAGRLFVGNNIAAHLIKKNLPAMQETPVQLLGWEDALVLS